MLINQNFFHQINDELQSCNARLVAVSKTKPAEAIRELYDLGHRDFGENYVQELVEKKELLPTDIRWHFIGHLQTNKVKYIAPFVHFIHGIDSYKLLKEVNKQAAKNKRTIRVLLQVHIAKEETKFGLDQVELEEIFGDNGQSNLSDLKHIVINGLMGMASFSTDTALVRGEFHYLKSLYDRYSTTQMSNVKFETLSMGMSSDYRIALEEGSTMVRIGSSLFGSR